MLGQALHLRCNSREYSRCSYKEGAFMQAKPAKAPLSLPNTKQPMCYQPSGALGVRTLTS